MPKIAEGDANKVWIVPSEIGKALEGLGSTMNEIAQGHPDRRSTGPRKRVDMGPTEPQVPALDATPEARVAERGGPGRPSPRPRRRQPGQARTTAAETARAPSADAGRSRRPEPRRPVSPSRSAAILLAGVGGRHHQHRGGVGNADHVPDPAGVRRASGHRQRVQQRRARARARCPGPWATAASWWASARGCCGWGRPRWSAASSVRCCCWGCPSAAFDAIVPVLIAARACCWCRAARASRARWPPAPRRAVAAPDHGAVVGLAGGRRDRRVRRLLRRGPGRAADGGAGDRRGRRPCSATTRLKNVLGLVVNAVAALVFIAVADVDWAVAGLIARGLGRRRPGRRPSVGRRAPALVLRAVIVVVGLTALVVALLVVRPRPRRPARSPRRRTPRVEGGVRRRADLGRDSTTSCVAPSTATR